MVPVAVQARAVTPLNVEVVNVPTDVATLMVRVPGAVATMEATLAPAVNVYAVAERPFMVVVMKEPEPHAVTESVPDAFVLKQRFAEAREGIITELEVIRVVMTAPVASMYFHGSRGVRPIPNTLSCSPSHEGSEILNACAVPAKRKRSAARMISFLPDAIEKFLKIGAPFLFLVFGGEDARNAVHDILK